MSSTARLNEVKVSFDADTLAAIDEAAQQSNQYRSTWLREAATMRLTHGSGQIDRTRYPDAVRAVLRIADGRLSRLQAEHIAAKVISTIAKQQ